jgi:hypothetical protein
MNWQECQILAYLNAVCLSSSFATNGNEQDFLECVSCNSYICCYVHNVLLLCIVSSNRKVLSLSSVALYRAARPRSGKFGVVLKPFPRSAYLTRKPKPFNSPVKTSNCTPTNSASEVDSSSHYTFEDHLVKEVASY